MNSLFQQVAPENWRFQHAGKTSSKAALSELQRMEGDPQSKMQRLQSAKPGAERSNWKDDGQRQTFSQKAQVFEQDRARRSNEERGKLVTRIQNAAQSVAKDQEHRSGG